MEFYVFLKFACFHFHVWIVFYIPDDHVTDQPLQRVGAVRPSLGLNWKLLDSLVLLSILVYYRQLLPLLGSGAFDQLRPEVTVTDCPTGGHQTYTRCPGSTLPEATK